MPREFYSASEAAKTLGISVDTLRRWDRQGRIRAERDKSNRRVVPASEIDRLRGEPGSAHLSARNRFNAVVTDVKIEGLMAQVEMVVSDPVRLVALVTRDAVEELQLRPGMTGVWQVAGASAIPISVMVELDSDYVESWSLWSDVKLIAVTASLVLLRKGL